MDVDEALRRAANPEACVDEIHRALADEVVRLREQLATAQQVGRRRLAELQRLRGMELRARELLCDLVRELLAWHDGGYVVMLRDHADALRHLLDILGDAPNRGGA